MSYRDQLIARLRLLNQEAWGSRVAEREVDVCVGQDRIVRINVDGVCVLRIRLRKGARVLIRK